MHNKTDNTTKTTILFYLMYSYAGLEQWTIYYANLYHIQVTGKDAHANADHLYNTVEADDKESDFESKPERSVRSSIVNTCRM